MQGDFYGCQRRWLGGVPKARVAVCTALHALNRYFDKVACMPVQAVGSFFGWRDPLVADRPIPTSAAPMETAVLQTV